MSDKTKNVLLYFIPAAAVFYITYLFSFRSVIVMDYGVLIERSYKIFLGEVPYRDFPLPTTPLTYYLQAAVWKIFNPSIFWMKIYIAAANTLLVLLAVRFAQKIVNLDFRLLALVVVPIAVAWSPGIILMRPWYDFDANFFGFIALFLLASGTFADRKSFFLLAGASAALSVYSKQNIGAGTTLAGFAFIAVQPGPLKDKFKNAVWYGAGLCVPSALLAAYYLKEGALGTAIEWIFVRAAGKTGDSFLGQLFGLVLRPDNNFVKYDFVLYTVGILLALRTRKEDPRKGGLHLGIALYGFICLWLSCLAERGNDYPQQQIYLSALFAVFAARLADKNPGWTLPSLLRRPAFLLLGAFAALTVYWPVHINWKVPFKLNVMKWTPKDESLRGMYLIQSDYRFVQDLMDFEKTVPKTDGIFVYPDPMFFHFATGRRSPTPHTTFQNFYVWEDPPEIKALTEKYFTEANVVWAVIGQEQMFDAGFLKYGLNETWESAVRKDLAMTTRGSHREIRDYLYKHYEEVPGGPAGYWLLKRKP